MAEPIRVMIVDDSAVVRQTVSQALASAPGIEVIAATADPAAALQKIRARWPDVLLVDIEMPRMDGIDFLKTVMAEHPTPTVVYSALTTQDAFAVCEALSTGVVAIVNKPRFLLKSAIESATADLIRAVRNAATANASALGSGIGQPGAERDPSPSGFPRPHHGSAPATEPSANKAAKIVAIGTSTGGTQALESVLTRLPASCVGIVVVQHMPAVFTAMFSERLNALCPMEVREACNGDQALPGRVLIAPGGKQMRLTRRGAQYVVEISDGPPVNRHKPSVDVLFSAVARSVGHNALGIIMTGMGDDGARGLKEMHDAGAQTIAQDEASCVVFGMPNEAIKLGAADHTLALAKIPEAIISFSADR